jgi:uncharacterized protein (DUF983 family)
MSPSVPAPGARRGVCSHCGQANEFHALLVAGLPCADCLAHVLREAADGATETHGPTPFVTDWQLPDQID